MMSQHIVDPGGGVDSAQNEADRLDFVDGHHRVGVPDCIPVVGGLVNCTIAP